MMEVTKYLDRAYAAYGDDRQLAAIMTDMEKQFDIPALAVNLPAWIERTPNGKIILAVYRKISGMRS